MTRAEEFEQPRAPLFAIAYSLGGELLDRLRGHLQELLPVRPLDRGDPLSGDQAVRRVIRTGREEVGVPELCFSHGDKKIRRRCHNRFPAGVSMPKANNTE